MKKSAQKLFDVTFGGTQTDGQFRPVKKSVWKDGEQYILLTPATTFTGLYSHPDKEVTYTRESMHSHLIAEARDYFSEKWAAMGYDKFAECPHCGGEINPAQLLAQKPRKRSPEAVEQSRQAANKPRPNAKGVPKKTFCKTCGKAIMVKGSKGYCDEHRPISTPQ